MVADMHTHSHKYTNRTASLGALIGTLIICGSVHAGSKFEDPLDLPAQMRTAVATRPLLAIAPAADSLVAVGSRGLIARSEDQGTTWNQSPVPVASDLLAVHFPNPRDGWAVGHDGVVLHSQDGGRTWAKQLDGRIAAETFKKFYANAAADPAMRAAATQMEQNFKAGPALPWLDVWFEDAQRGFIVGSFGMIAATTDGGKTWEPWMHRIDNDKGLNLNGIRNVGGNLYVVGEHGMVFKLDRQNMRFQKTVTGYAGSFFGIVGNDDTLLAFGLRGVVYRSRNGGDNWEALKMPTDATVTAAALKRDSRSFVLVNSAGQILVGDAQSDTFRIVTAAKPMRYTGVALLNPTTVILTGLDGARSEKISDGTR